MLGYFNILNQKIIKFFPGFFCRKRIVARSAFLKICMTCRIFVVLVRNVCGIKLVLGHFLVIGRYAFIV